MNPFRAAMREAGLIHPAPALSVLFLAPAAIVPYVSLLAVESSARVASDCAYLLVMLAVHAIAIQLGVAVRSDENGYRDLMRVRGMSEHRMRIIRASGFFIRGILPYLAVLSGAIIGARLSGARDELRIVAASLGAVQTFGLSVFMISVLPRQAASICAAAIVFLGHIPSPIGSAFSLLPQYQIFDLWPGTGITWNAIIGLSIWSMLYAVGAIVVGTSLAGRRSR